MAQADLSDLRKSVLGVIRDSAVADHLKNLEIEPNRDNYGSDFLDIAIELNALDDIPDEALAKLIVRIEDVIMPLDDRFPSVRFPAEAIA